MWIEANAKIQTPWFRLACVMGMMGLGGFSCAKDDATTNAEDAGTTDAASDDDGNDLTITLTDGKIEGDMAGDARRFLAIPFAKPPLGELRWKAPVAPEPWKGTRHETEFPDSCAQLPDQGAPPSMNEDCLYLNVWAPNPAPADAPVMVWIHGGGNFSGGTGIPVPATATDQLWYDGQHFAEDQGVVLVTIQYRLGPMGFLAHATLDDEGEPMGNQGLQDQRMALKWVQKNIAKFGGDPDNVTIFGESAGSADVCYHVVSPGSRDLFHRAIGQSGGCTMGRQESGAALPEIQAQMAAFGEALGCSEGDDQLDCMRDVSIEDILANSMQPAPGSGDIAVGTWSFGAVIDGAGGFLPDVPKKLFDNGKFADVPYLLGSNNDEGMTFIVTASDLPTTDAEYETYVTDRYGADAPDILALYPMSDYADDPDRYRAAVARIIGDSALVCGTHDTARRVHRAGRKVFMYNFNVPWSISPTRLRAGHGAEMSHVFGAPYLPSPDADSEAVAKAMNTYWANFARSGDPNSSDVPKKWPEFTEATDKRLQLDSGFEVLTNFRSEVCTYWRKRAGADD